MIVHQISNSYGNYNYNAFIYTNQGWDSHFHKNYELIYIMSGAMTVLINGKQTELQKGEMLLVSPYTIHSFVSDERSIVWVGVFAEEYIKSFSKQNSNVQYSKFRCEEKIDEFLNEYLFFQGQPDIHMAKSCLYMVCSECLRKAFVTDTKTATDFKGRIIEFITENLSGEITLANTAQALGYEYHYFSALFHRCFEMNFREFINIFRIEYASELLMDKTKDIAYVACECGFQSIRNFNRVFKKLSGKTPSEYRAKSIG